MQHHSLMHERPNTKRLGYDVIGPIVHRWLLGLHQYIAYYDDGQTQYLYCARAGVRIKKLLDIYFSRRGLALSAPGEVFWISRLSVCKGVFAFSESEAAEVIAGEFERVPLSDLLRALLKNAPEILAKIDLAHESLRAHGTNFPGWIRGSSADASLLRGYLSECSDCFKNYLDELTRNKKRILLIDSGWQGTAQKLLDSAFVDLEWRGAYIGRMLQEKFRSNILHNVFGILFENDVFDPRQPATVISIHRHLFETMLEPNGPSIEEIPGGRYGSAVEGAIRDNLNEKIDPYLDQIYMGVEQYIEENAAIPLSEILSRYEDTLPRLSQLLAYPTPLEARALICKDRSADFGRSTKVPVIVTSEENSDTSEVRISKAIWKQGQIALEYPDDAIRRDIQQRALGLSGADSYFHPSTEQEITWDHGCDPTNTLSNSHVASVAIITRTKNRPLLLARAAESVVNQTYSDYVWVIVNDGGSKNAVLEVIERSSVDRRKIRLISHSVSKGMEAASNAGIGACKSEYVVIHDDDDTWHPKFLESTVSYLSSPRGSRYGGVVTGVKYVSEEIRGGKVVEHDRVPYHDWIRNIHFPEMARGNLFPPIAFLFKRSLYDSIGGYNESLPVLGDWFFNLEFLMKSDIGVLPDPLAYYHHRDRNNSTSLDSYSNSVIGGVTKHEEFASVARNEFIRKYHNNSAAVSAIVSGYFQSETRHMLDAVRGTSAERLPDRATLVGKGVLDEFDRLWVISKYNENLGSLGGVVRRGLTLFTQGSRLRAEDDWEKVIAACAGVGFKAPAPANFDTDSYLLENPDVKRDVHSGKLYSGYHHYIIFGRVERRRRPLC
ncbi:glycosyltransferase [Stappia indica]|uniref:glycosyltransferase n=1 Tax=Stappia indica TaxID=538381 RepID=UPI00082C5BAB|nr:glycosyltransferase [Stappia indica]